MQAYGPTLLCINTLRDVEEDHIYRSGSHPRTEAEETMLYAFFSIMETDGEQTMVCMVEEKGWEG